MTAVPSPTPGPEVDRDNPWPGLSSFTEDLRFFFFGREKETEELVRLVRRNTLTVLFGQSGLGKSSLLQAGVFPVLREADFLPLYLRLDHDPSAPPLADQVKAALVEAFKSAGADAPAPRPDESLWEYFHRKDIDIWSAKNRLLTPVLAFDQFEEIFTLGRADDARRERGRAFLTELADLVENRPPAALREKFDSGELDTARYAFDKPSCQVILSLREDFLPDLEGLKNEMRSLMHSRMRVRRLTGTQALEIVTRPAPNLLADGVAERVVEFVAGGRGGSAERLAELEVEPALLSVICRELNQRRRALGQERITVDLVSGNRREILNDFYERSVSDLPPAMREFIEDHLLTKSGFRDNLALETVLEAPGVTRPLVDTLVSRRLLRIEDRLGVQRVELTHDVLADVIRASRDSRQQRLALEQARAQERDVRRRVWWLRGIAAGLVAVLAGVSALAFWTVRGRDRNAARSDLVVAAQLLDRGNARDAVAYLVHAARTDPGNPVAGSRIISALARHNWPIFGDTGAKLPSPGFETHFLPDGKRILIYGDDGVVRLLDAKTYQILREVRFPVHGGNIIVSRRNTEVFAVIFGDGSAAVASLKTGEEHVIPGPGSGDRWSHAALSPDGKWLALVSNTQIGLVDAARGGMKAALSFPTLQNPASLNFSQDSTRLAYADWDMGFEILSVPSMEALVPWIHPSEYNAGGAAYADFSPDGSLCAVGWWQGFAFFDAATGALKGSRTVDVGQVDFALFDGDGRRLITLSEDRAAQIWEVATGRELVPPLRHGGSVAYGALSNDGRTLLTWSNDDLVHIWDTNSGRLIIDSTNGVPGKDVLALDPDGSRVLFCPPDGRLLSLKTTLSGIEPVVWAPQGGPLRFGAGSSTSLATNFYDDGSRALFHLGASGIRTLSLESFDLNSKEVPFPSGLYFHDYQAKDRRLLESSDRNGFSIWQEHGNVFTKTLDLAGSKGMIHGHFVDARPFIVLAGRQKDQWRFRLWHSDSGLPAGPEIYQQELVSDASLSADSERVAAGGAGGFAAVWDVKTGRQVVRLKNPSNASIPMIRFGPDGKVIATGSYRDGLPSGGRQYAEARLWSAETGEPLGPPYLHRENIQTVAFSSDGRMAAFSSNDGTADVVSTATGTPVCPTLVHPDATLLAERYDPLQFVGSDRIATGTRKGFFLWDAWSGLQEMEPYPPSGGSMREFTIDSERKYVALIAPGGRVTVWPLPPRYERKEVPAWLLKLARALSGKSLDANGNLVASDAGFEQRQAELVAVQKELDSLPADAPYAEWGRWILADPDTRPIAPGLNITLAEARARGLAD